MGERIGLPQWDVKERTWIAQRDLLCPECDRIIKIGHHYKWKEKRIGRTIQELQVHPGCV